MGKLFVLCIAIILSTSGCDKDQKNDTIKMTMTTKMHEKVKKIAADLKAYCDSETYRKAKWKVDSILLKKVVKH